MLWKCLDEVEQAGIRREPFARDPDVIELTVQFAFIAYSTGDEREDLVVRQLLHAGWQVGREADFDAVPELDEVDEPLSFLGCVHAVEVRGCLGLLLGVERLGVFLREKHDLHGESLGVVHAERS